MRWVHNGKDAIQFMKSSPPKYYQSPQIFFHRANSKEMDLEFNLIVYPRGWNNHHTSMQVFLCSDGEIPPDTPKTISFWLTYACSLNDTKICNKVKLHRDEKGNGYQYHIKSQVTIQHLDSLVQQSKYPDNIIFECSISEHEPRLKPIQHGHSKENTSFNVSTIPSLPTESKQDPSHSEPQPIDPGPALTISTLTSIPSHHSSPISLRNLKSKANQWRIPSAQMGQFEAAQVGESFESQVFTLSNQSRWKLMIYPHGPTQDKRDSVALFLHCLSLPPQLEAQSVLFDVHFVEIDVYSSNTFQFGPFNIAEFRGHHNEYGNIPYSDAHSVYSAHHQMNHHHHHAFREKMNSVPLWHPYTVESKQLKFQKGLTIKVTLSVLREHCHPNSVEDQHRTLGFVHRELKFNPMSQIQGTWTLPITSNVTDARHKKLFASPRFDIWCLRFIPNRGGQCCLQTYLVTGNDFECEITMKCPQFGSEWTGQRVFDRKQKQDKWTEWEMGICPKQLEGLRSLRFVVNIVITDAVDDYHGVKNDGNDGDKVNVNEEEQGVNDLLELKEKFESLELTMNTLQDEAVKLRKERKLWNGTEHKECGDGILCDDVHDPNDPEWDFQQLELWFKEQLRLPQYQDVFIDHGWDDLEIIKNNLTEQHLQEMKITKTGHRVKIMHHTNALKNSTNR